MRQLRWLMLDYWYSWHCSRLLYRLSHPNVGSCFSWQNIYALRQTTCGNVCWGLTLDYWFSWPCSRLYYRLSQPNVVSCFSWQKIPPVWQTCVNVGDWHRNIDVVGAALVCTPTSVFALYGKKCSQGDKHTYGNVSDSRLIIVIVGVAPVCFADSHIKLNQFISDIYKLIHTNWSFKEI